MIQQYNIFQAIGMSFYSRKLYRDVAQNWGGKAFLYLIMLLALSWIYAVVVMQISINHFYATFSDTIVPQIPVLTIKNGKISTPEPRPYYIVDPKTRENIAVIDTTGKITTLEQANSDVLLTQTELITNQKNKGETRIDKVPDKLSYVVVPKVIDSYLVDYFKLAWVLLFPLLVISSFIYRILQALFYSILGRIFGSICSAGVKYGQVVQISLIAVTPAIVIATIQEMFGVNFPHQIWYYFLLSMCYIFYGVMANKK